MKAVSYRDACLIPTPPSSALFLLFASNTDFGLGTRSSTVDHVFPRCTSYLHFPMPLPTTAHLQPVAAAPVAARRSTQALPESSDPLDDIISSRICVCVYSKSIYTLPAHIRCCMRYPSSLRIASRRAVTPPFSLAKCAGTEGSAKSLKK
jgi:hypothetical protein